MYGILSLIKKMYGKKAMRRVLEIIKKYPEERNVKILQNRGAPPWWYETYDPASQLGGRGGYSEGSRLGSGKILAEGSSRYLDPYPGTFMNYVRHQVPKRETFKDVANYYRLNPEKRKPMDEWYRETGAETKWSKGFMDDMIKDAIRAMTGKNLGIRKLTDHEKYMLTLMKQRRQKTQKGAEIIPFPRKD